MCLIVVRCRHILHDDDEREETWSDIFSAYFTLGNYDVVLKEDFKRVTKISENLPEIIIFFYENFQRGNRMTPMILLFPVISYVGFTLSMGDATGEKFFAELKQLRDSEDANEAWLAELYYRYINGFLYTILYLLPVIWITHLES